MTKFQQTILFLVLLGFLGIFYYLDKRTSKLENSIESIQQDVKEIKASIVYQEKLQVKLTKQDKECLAKNIMQEAGVESYVGKIAVGHVTMNRVQSSKWGKNVCSVVYARKQFSWTISKKKKYEKLKGPLWEESLKAAEDITKGARVNTIPNNTLWYHTDYVNPRWANPKKKVDKIGQHIFYNGVKT